MHCDYTTVLMYLDWQWLSGLLASWEGLLLATDVSTTCAEAIFRVKWLDCTQMIIQSRYIISGFKPFSYFSLSVVKKYDMFEQNWIKWAIHNAKHYASVHVTDLLIYPRTSRETFQPIKGNATAKLLWTLKRYSSCCKSSGHTFLNSCSGISRSLFEFGQVVID